MWERIVALGLLFSFGQAQLSARCSASLSAVYPLPSVAPGYVVRLVANGLETPRSIKFDSQGRLLVVESGKGVTALTLTDSGGGCIKATGKQTVVARSSLNHGLELSSDGTTLYASDPDKVYRWKYNPGTQTTSGPAAILVDGMNGTSHITRTLLLSKTAVGMLLVSHGSDDDIDPLARQLSSGSAQIRAFDITKSANFPYDFDSSGTVMGWGLRNDVGMAEEPVGGGLYSVENGANAQTRNGVDIHNTNPAEEMNFLGYVDGSPKTPNKGANFGYPDCFSVWNPDIPDFNGRTGQVLGSDSTNDTMCANTRQAPELVFAAHSAPIDILFDDAGTTGWITFRGSDLITPSVGYGLGTVKFSNGNPVASVHVQTALTYIAQSKNVQRCRKTNCWAPVGLAWDSKGRLFMSTDYTGEIYVILRSDGSGPNS